MLKIMLCFTYDKQIGSNLCIPTMEILQMETAHDVPWATPDIWHQTSPYIHLSDTAGKLNQAQVNLITPGKVLTRTNMTLLN